MGVELAEAVDRQVIISLSELCKKHPHDHRCPPAGFQGNPTGPGGVEWPRDLFRNGAWESLGDAELAQFEEEQAAFEATLTDDPVQRSLALAQFHGSRDRIGLKVGALRRALGAADSNTDKAIALEIANTVRTIGFHEAALNLYQALQPLIPSTGIRNNLLLGEVLQNQARALEALGRTQEADASFALARHTLLMAGQIRGSRLRNR